MDPLAATQQCVQPPTCRNVADGTASAACSVQASTCPAAQILSPNAAGGRRRRQNVSYVAGGKWELPSGASAAATETTAEGYVCETIFDLPAKPEDVYDCLLTPERWAEVWDGQQATVTFDLTSQVCDCALRGPSAWRHPHEWSLTQTRSLCVSCE